MMGDYHAGVLTFVLDRLIHLAQDLQIRMGHVDRLVGMSHREYHACVIQKIEK